VKSLVSGQRAVLRDVRPKIGKQLSKFESDEYTHKRLAVFEAEEAKLLEELRNYSQHKFLPYLNPAWQFSQTVPMAEFQFRLHVEPLLKWDSLNAEVRTYLEQQGDSIDLQPIIARYTKAVREFYEWFWLKVEEKMRPERIEYDAHVAELTVYGEEVFLTPDWIQQPGGEPPTGPQKTWARHVRPIATTSSNCCTLIGTVFRPSSSIWRLPSTASGCVPGWVRSTATTTRTGCSCRHCGRPAAHRTRCAPRSPRPRKGAWNR
jgi:hypothetical protein